ncbi:hypothetical protein [Litchfieldia alkalitelluris]|uniref:hypothetical protein n=1 Tax=Litchfieldia alkalitelluris TaxID=304268 RepID=UPI000996C694|nr:hypothetical protein [Litchfieldia alkalitelluris]
MMNIYMEISLIFILILAVSISYNMLKGSQRTALKVLSISCISAISITILWRAAHLVSYFN